MSDNLRHEISGYAATYHRCRACFGADDFRPVVFQPHAFDSERLRKFVDGGGKLLFNHSYAFPIGRITRAVVDERGVLVDAEFLDTPVARVLRSMIFEQLERNEDVGLSAGWTNRNFYKHPDDTIEVREADLNEVSVMVGNYEAANPYCFITSSKSYPAPAPKPRVTKSTYRPGYRTAVEFFDPAMEARKKHWPPGMQIKDCAAWNYE